MVLVCATTPCIRAVSVQSLPWIEGPTYVSNASRSGIREGVNMPCTNVCFHTLLYHLVSLCGYKGESQLDIFDLLDAPEPGQ